MTILKCIWKNRGTSILKTILRKKNKLGESTTQFQDSLYSYTNQDCVVLLEGRHKDQWNRREMLKISPYRYRQLIFDKGMKAFDEGKIFFQ